MTTWAQRFVRSWSTRHVGRRKHAPSPIALTEREISILRLAAEGKTNVEIAHDVLLAPDTIKKSFDVIRGKLSAVDRTNAVAIAFRRGLIS